jgi:transcriptional regulator with XRE-family HTH domain
MNDEKKYPELIRRLRKRIGVSQEKFASQVGVVLATIYRYEGGKSDPDPPILAKLIEFAEKEAPDIAAPLRDEYRRLFGAALNGSQLTPEREALLSSLRALLADERHSRKVSDKLSSILLDMREKEQNVVAPRKKAR